MSEFGRDMMAQLDAYHNAAVEPVKEKVKATVKYECEVSGIDMIVSKNVGDKCTMKMYVCLSQPDANGDGIIFIKNMKGGVVKEGTVENINTFLRELSGRLSTGSNVIPYLEKGKDFAEMMYEIRKSAYIDAIKEGLFNIMFLGDYSYAPWYMKDVCRRRTSEDYGVEDRHAKLIRHCVEKMSERYRMSYAAALYRTCNGSADYKLQSVWAFSMLADFFDEPFAMKCFDEYLDNERLGGLSCDGMRKVFKRLNPRCDDYYNYYEWANVVEDFKKGVNQKAILEKNRFWQFIQQAVAVGLGKRLDNYLDLYSDYISQAVFCDGKLRDKYPEHLQVAHDIYTEKYTIVKEFRDEEILREKTQKGAEVINQIHDGYQLSTLMTVKDFLEEAQQNCNCVASYVDRVKAGKCWVASFRKVGDDVTQLTVEVDPAGKLVQIKGKYNREPTTDELHILDKFRNSIINKLKAPVPPAGTVPANN